MPWKKNMEKSFSPYRALQQHLDKQPLGFPAVDDGSDIKILKHIFTPVQARIAACMDYHPESLETIYDKSNHLVDAKVQLEKMLYDMEKRGGIEIRKSGDTFLFCNAPLIVGMYEFQLNRMTPEFIDDFARYTSSRKFGINFLSAESSQMRTIPIQQSIQIESHVEPFDKGFEIIRKSKGPFAICECICRAKKKMTGNPCKQTRRKETCLGIGDLARAADRTGMGRLIEKAEAISILEQNQKDGLVMQPSNTREVEFICSCCGCCCGMLNMQKGLPKPLRFWSTNYYAALEVSQCIGCKKCMKKCQVAAISFLDDRKQVEIDTDRCIGCGQCIPACEKKALLLVQKKRPELPQPTRQALHEHLMDHKKGSIGKLKLTGQLVMDAIQKGEFRKLVSR
jgi:electron transport complex protein RnfB